MALQKLYLRIWLAVVATVAVLTLLVGLAWRMHSEPPVREVVVRDTQGRVLGAGASRPYGMGRDRAHGSRPVVADEDLPRRGPEFEVRLHDGQTLMLTLQRPPRSPPWWAPFGFVWTLALVAVAVALATYPIVRRLTRHLEQLQQGVQRLGEGDWAVRVAVHGSDEVAQLAQGFNQSAQRIQALVGARDAVLASQKSLLANASHELRSPLARIRMGLELLDHGNDAPSQRLHGELARNIAELDALVDELLLISRLDGGQADWGTVERIDLRALSQEECKRAHIALDCPEAAVVVPGVAQLLRRLVRNLLEYGQRASADKAVLQLRALPQGGAALTLFEPGRVRETAQSERLFEPFYRSPGASEKDGGVGLGLALVKAIAQHHGAQVRGVQDPTLGAGLQLEFPAPAAKH